MEDAHTTLLKLEDTDASFFGVYDGHGGKAAASTIGCKNDIMITFVLQF